MNAQDSLEQAARRVQELLRGPETRLATVDADRIAEMVADAVRRVKDGGPGTLLRAVVFARPIVDAGGVTAISAALDSALLELEEAGAAAAELRLIPRVVIRDFRESGVPVSAQEVREIRHEGVLVPNLALDDEGLALPQMRAEDGRTFIPAFSDRYPFDHWAEGAGVRPRAVMMRIADAGDAVLRSGASGLVVNPLQENVVFTAEVLEEVLRSSTIYGGSSVAFGVPAAVPSGLEDLVVATLGAVPGASCAAVASVVSGTTQRLVVVVGHDGSSEAVAEFARVLGARLGSGSSVDVMDGTSELGRQILQELPNLVAR